MDQTIIPNIMQPLRYTTQPIIQWILLWGVLAGFSPSVSSQQTVGTILTTSDSWSGYTLFNPTNQETTYLINACGQVVHSWELDSRPGLSLYFMENGDLLRTGRFVDEHFSGGGIGGIIQRFNWDGNLVWTDTIASNTLHLHHDIEPMPNGNILAIAWEEHTADEAVELGRLPENTADEVWAPRILELQPTGNNGSIVVWSWTAWDHLVQNTDSLAPHFGDPADFPRRMDINFQANPNGGGGPGNGQSAYDWMHLNAVDYHSDRDEILISSHHWSEIWIIDHSTSTEEASGSIGGQSGYGGDLLWRWGNPVAYGRGNESDQQLFKQHDAKWINNGFPGEGDISVFNNGKDRPEGPYSTVHEIQPTVEADGNYSIPSVLEAFGPIAPSWTYPETLDGSFYSQNISGSQKLENGNTLICEGQDGRFLEIDAAGTPVWEYINPTSPWGPIEQGNDPISNAVFRVERIPLDHPGLIGKDLTPGDPIELNPEIADCVEWLSNSIEVSSSESMELALFPNPATDGIWVSANQTVPTQVDVYTAFGRRWRSFTFSNRVWIPTSDWPRGMYLFRTAIERNDSVLTTPIIIQ
ncbi:MAG: aryl-sulfate sulfotransferase [Flavobacteriales bacterium]|nr:aryl-sulfate sulfotransferase [Flavobacteriales bacterium]